MMKPVKARKPKMIWRKVVTLPVCALLCAEAVGCLPPPTPLQPTTPGLERALQSLAGVWQDINNPEFFVAVEGPQILMASSGRVREAATALRPVDGGLMVCEDGHEVLMEMRRAGEVIEFFHARDGKNRRLRRMATKPEALSLSLELPDPFPLPEERILAIQKEIRVRLESDQSTLRQRIQGREETLPWLKDSQSATYNQPVGMKFLFAERSGENAEYMRALIQEVGWVDAKRFGYPTSSNAFVLVQHSWDLPLMLSVLPRIREDVDAGLMNGETYALLLDRVRIALGLPQRFGSQIVKNPSGEWIVLPLEEPDGVEARRRQMGMLPLKEYVGVFGVTEVKLSTECSALTSAGPRALGHR